MFMLNFPETCQQDQIYIANTHAHREEGVIYIFLQENKRAIQNASQEKDYVVCPDNNSYS